MVREIFDVSRLGEEPGDFFLRSASIEASAGTGKTYAVENIVKYLIMNDGRGLAGGKPVSLSEILIVTFTNKAAGELRSRIRSTLTGLLRDRTAGNGNDTTSDTGNQNELSEEKMKRIENALSEIDNAPIFTFHSFCSHVLSLYGFEAGIPDGFTLVNNDSLMKIIERRCRDVWAYDPFFCRMITECGTDSPDKIILDVFSIAEKYNPVTMRLIPSGGGPGTFEEMKDILQSSRGSLLIAAAGKFIRDLKRECAGTPPDLVLFRKMLVSPEEILKRADDPDTVSGKNRDPGEKLIKGYGEAALKQDIETLSGLSPAGSGAGSDAGSDAGSGSGSDAGIPDTEKCIRCVEALYSLNNKTEKDFRKDFFGRLMQEFCLREVPVVYREWQSYKSRNLYGTYDDLIGNVYRSCRNDPSALLEKLRRKYRYGIIDEFQDTNVFQWGIFRRIFLDAPDHCIYVVGDPKQAIYSFRGADTAVYRSACREIEEKTGYEGYRLSGNFRSSEPMINGANIMFSGSAGTAGPGRFSGEDSFRLFGSSDVPFSPSGYGRKGLSLKPLLNGEEVPPFIVGDSGQTAGQYAHFCAGLIRHIVGKVMIPDKKDRSGNAMRPLRYSDIAVLTRTHAEAEVFKRAFSSGQSVRHHVPPSAISAGRSSPADAVPYTSDREDTLFDGSECAAWAVLLRAVCARGDLSSGIKLRRAALITPFFGKTLNEARRFDFDDRSDPFAIDMSEYRKAADGQQWARLIRLIFTRSGIEKRLLEQGDRAGFAAYRQIADYIAECLCTRGMSPEKTAGHLDAIRNGTETPFSEDDRCIGKESGRDSVRIMTIHRSKGLEFPVVILGGGIAGFKHHKPYIFSAGSSSGDNSGCPSGFNSSLPSSGGGSDTGSFSPDTAFSDPDASGDVCGNDSFPVRGISYDEYFKDVSKNEIFMEWYRLFYVAMTRARFLMILPRYLEKPRSVNPSKEFLCQSVDRFLMNSDGLPEKMSLSDEALATFLEKCAGTEPDPSCLSQSVPPLSPEEERDGKEMIIEKVRTVIRRNAMTNGGLSSEPVSYSSIAGNEHLKRISGSVYGSGYDLRYEPDSEIPEDSDDEIIIRADDPGFRTVPDDPVSSDRGDAGSFISSGSPVSAVSSVSSVSPVSSASSVSAVSSVSSVSPVSSASSVSSVSPVCPGSDDPDYPAGKDFGNAIHEVMASLRFSEASDPENKTEADRIRDLIAFRFSEWGLFRNRSPDNIRDITEKTLDVIRETLGARLPKLWQADPSVTFILGSIPDEDRISEMSFNMGLLRNTAGGSSLCPGKAPTWFFRGSPDLVFRIDGRYCIIDWKGNRIGDYSEAGIRASMERSFYFIQQTLYSFFLIEWLASVRGIRDDDGKRKIYDEEFGAVCYCYLRGTKSGTSCGFSCRRYSSYDELRDEFRKEVQSRLSDPACLSDPDFLSGRDHEEIKENNEEVRP